MKKAFVLFVLMASFYISFAQVNPNQIWVEGYFRSDGKYVKGHYRTLPNSIQSDNINYPNKNQGEAFVLPQMPISLPNNQSTYSIQSSEASTYYMSGDTHYKTAKGLFEQKKYAEAAFYYELAIDNLKHTSYNLEVLYGFLFMCYVLNDDLEKAIKFEREQPELFFRDYEINTLMGFLYMSHDLYLNAVELFKTAVNINPTCKNCVFMLGQAYNKTGNTELGQHYTEISRSMPE